MQDHELGSDPQVLVAARRSWAMAKIFEPDWASVVAKLAASHDLPPDDKYAIAGYWAHLSTCTPAWRRIAADLQQRD